MKKAGFLVLIFILFFLSFWSRTSEPYIGNFFSLNKSHFSVINFGDVMFDRGVRNIIENRKRDPFEYIKKDLNLFKNYDFVIVNLEGPIVEMDRALCQQKAYNFQFATDTTDRLKSVGINMVNIANNHSYDCYKVGFESTKSYLREGGIDYIGDDVLDNSFVVKKVKDKKVVFVGIDETVQIVKISGFYPLIQKLKSENDYVIVNIHWGTEYELKENSIQREIAHKLIDSGADVVFGHHPHVIEPMEVYKNGVVFYSLGNFVFDQNFGDTTVGLGVGVEFRENGKHFSLYPFNIKLFAPDFMSKEDEKIFCDKYLTEIPHKNCSFYNI